MPTSCPFHLRAASFALIAVMTQVADAAEVSRKVFMKKAQSTCGGAACVIDIATVPAKHVYEVTSVSCRVAISDVSSKVGTFYLTAEKSGSELGQLHMRPFSNGISGVSAAFSATETGLVRAPAGSVLRVWAIRDTSTAGNVAYLQCTVSGDNVRYR